LVTEKKLKSFLTWNCASRSRANGTTKLMSLLNTTMKWTKS